MTDGPVRTVFLGSGAFGEPSLRKLASHPLVELVGVVTAPARPAGRSQALARTPIDEAAAKLGVPTILTPARLRDDAATAAVLGLGADVLVLADYGSIVPLALLSPRYGALNLHPSLLPRHRGATPIQGAILAGDRETGVTLMQMDAGLDTGPIVVQTTVALEGDEIAPDLEARLAELAAELLMATLGPWVRGEIVARPQPDNGATLTRPLRRDDGRIDTARSAAELERQIRALQPWPGSFVETDAGRLVVWAAADERDPGSPPRGVFDALGLGVDVGERLRLFDVQPAGGRRMAWPDFVLGHPSIVGASIIG